MRKRILAAAIAALCCTLAILPAASAEAVETEPITIAVDTVSGTVEEGATVTVSLSGGEKMDSIQFRVNYDQTALKLTAAQAGEMLKSGITEINTDTAGLVSFAFAAADSIAADGTALSLTFSLLNETGSAVTLSDVLASSYDAAAALQEKAYVSLTDGGVTVGEDASVPEPVVTPWPVETPEPSPTPEPTATAEPAEIQDTAEATPEATLLVPQDSIFQGKTLLYLAIGVAVILIVVVILLIAAAKKRKRRKRRRQNRANSKRNSDEF